MIRRIIDLTQSVAPANQYQRDYPPPWADFEATGLERTRVELQRLVKAEPFYLDGNPNELMMNIAIGHSTGTGHTHVDCFLHDWTTLYEDVPRDGKWAQRDISQVPSHELMGPAAVVDISAVAPTGEITLDFFREQAKHVQPADIVFIRTGHAKYANDPKYKGEDFSVVTPEVMEWLAKEKLVRVCGFDHKINGNFAIWARAERACYRNGILMIDKVAHLDKLDAEQRYFANVGLSLKMQGVDDSPARLFVIDKLEDIANGGNTTDLFFPIDCPWTAGDPPYARQEPFSEKYDIMNRFQLTNVHMTQTEYPENAFGGPGFLGLKQFTNHLGTHMKVPYTPGKTDAVYDFANLATERLWGRCVLVDAWAAGPTQDVTAAMLEKAEAEITEGTIVLVRTAYADYYAGHSQYLRYSPGFSDDAIGWLLKKRVKMVVTDCATVESAENNGKIGVQEHTGQLLDQGILVVNSAHAMWRIRKPESVAFISPMAFPNLNASPCRVMVLEEYR